MLAKRDRAVAFQIGAFVFIVFGPAVLYVAGVNILTGHTKSMSSGSVCSPSELVGMLGNRPRKVEFDPISIDLSCDRQELSRYLDCVATSLMDESVSRARSRRLHAARLLVLSGRRPEWIESDSLGSNKEDRIRLRAEDYIKTWRGLEAVSTLGGDRSEHRDQTISALAELGVNLDATIETADGERCVSELLATSIGEFHLDQAEISWSASAIASYLPPQTTWWNRFGEKFSFDSLVREIMSRKFDRESCRGLHLVTVLTKILRIDEGSNILSPDVRDSLAGYIRKRLSEAIESQLDDGSWPLLWSRVGFAEIAGYTPEDSNVNRVMVTGHMLEWFHLLPSDMKPPAGVVQSGSSWVLENLRASSREDISKEFCPYTHAVLSLYIAR